MKNVAQIGIIWILVLHLFGCKQDIANASWDVDVLAPVIRTELTMADLLADSLITSYDGGKLRLNVERPLIDLPLDSILKIPDTTISKDISTPVALNDLPPGFDIPATLSDQTTYDLGGLALRNVTIRSGRLELKIKSTVETAVEFEYLIPLATKFGNSFVSQGRVEAGSVTDTAEAQYTFDLTDYKIDLRGADGSGFNTLVTGFRVNTAADGDSVSIPPGTFLKLEYSFLEVVPSYGAGYFGQQTTSSESENAELDVLNRITEGQMFLDSVNIALKITNPVGADARFILSELSSINRRTNSTISLEHEIIDNDILLTRAQDPTGNEEDVVPFEVIFEVKNENSNIVEFIENLPDELGFQYDFELNPLGNISGGNDFFYYNRPFQALMNIDIPLRARLDNLTLVDTVDWNVSESGVVDAVNSGVFTLIAVNGLPLEGQVELVLLDEALNQLGTLVAPSTVNAPSLNAQRMVEQPLETRVEIPVSESIASALKDTRKVMLKVRFHSAGQPELVDFYVHYSIDLKLVGRFNIDFSSAL